jgi:N-acetyl-alpha-D-muramate 1-phosphate uridylyltransferase
MTAQAMLLAAGRGERMRPLTDTTPKPLLNVRGQPLMAWHLNALAKGGVTDVVINTAWLGDQISTAFGGYFTYKKWPEAAYSKREQLLNSEQSDTLTSSQLPFVVSIDYSHEGADFGGALETAGGIARALPRLGDVFWVLAGDVFAPDFEFSQTAVDRFKKSGKLAHLWLVRNPEHNLQGDFGLSATGLALNLPRDSVAQKYTFSTIGLYQSALFAPPFCDIPAGNPLGVKAALAPLLRAAMDKNLVSAELYSKAWTDVGTPQRLQLLNQGENRLMRGADLPRKPQGKFP